MRRPGALRRIKVLAYSKTASGAGDRHVGRAEHQLDEADRAGAQRVRRERGVDRRPQQQRAKEAKRMLTELKRGDRVVTGGGILGTVTKPPKPEDREIEVEIGANMQVTVLRETISSVIKPVAANDVVKK